VGTAGVLLLLAFSAAIATGIIAYIIIRRRAEKERQRREAEEAQRIAEEERQRREAEEAQRKAEEDRQRHEAEEAQRRAEKEHRRPVEDRGGKPRILPTESKEQVIREPKLRQPKPEIVCWQRERRWILAVEVPEDLWEKPELAVHLNASPLAQDEREGHWRLDQVYGQVTVHWEEETPQETKIALGEEHFLLFKLSGQDQKRGRRIRSSSSGSYLVVVPENWARDEELSGSPRASPEPVSVKGYQGHFFDLERGSDKRIAFRTPEGKPILIESRAARFELIGTQLNDASEGIGPLFGQNAPQIRASHDRVWADISTVIIGEEGSGRGKWRKSFSPAPEGREQRLPAEVAPRKDGWYFLRFYDMDDDLVESLDFRLVCALREIKVFQPSPFPSEGEHGPVYAEFTHEPDCAIQPTDDLARSIQVEGKGNKTRLTIPPSPTYDETGWRVGSNGTPQMHITILVERLWWAVGQEGILPLEWEDELLSLICDDFAPTSKKALWLRLPVRRWTDRVLVGFEQSRAKPCPVKVTAKEISIPLRDIGDYQEMRGRDRDQFLNIWIERDSELVEGIVAIIPASKGPILCIERGRKKAAIATVALREGAGAVKVNGQPVADYFKKAPLRARRFLWRLLELPYVSQALSQMEVSIEVTGSNPGTIQQVKASAHSLARALMKYDPQLKPLLKREGFGGAKVTKRSSTQGKR